MSDFAKYVLVPRENTFIKIYSYVLNAILRNIINYLLKIYIFSKTN